MKHSLFLIIVFSVLIFSGCAATSSVGDRMIDQAKAAEHLGKQWNKGERMVKKGERMLAAAERLADESSRDASKSEKMSSEAQDLIQQGREIMTENQQEFSEKFTN